MSASLLIGLALAVGAPGPKETPKKEASIVGEWIGEKAVSGGKELPVPPGGIGFTFTADGVLMIKEGPAGKREGADTGSYKIDPKKDPAEIDLIPPAKKNDPNVQGIYKLDGDKLILCFGRGAPGKERPKKFESPEGSDLIVITMKRAKKE